MRITGERWDPPHEMGQEAANIPLRKAFNQVHRGRVRNHPGKQEDWEGKKQACTGEGGDPEEELL